MKHYISSCSRLYDNRVTVNGRLVFYQENIHTFADFIKTAYRQEQISYPKFFKMDALSKLGFLAAELALKETETRVYQPESVGVVFANSSSSLDTDIAHQATINDRAAYFPSPSVFVYTLPNIVIGEVCIRHGFKGENAFLISEAFDAKLLYEYVDGLFSSGRSKACLAGWIEVMGNRCNAMVVFIEPGEPGTEPGMPGFGRLEFNEKNLQSLMETN